MVVNICGTQSDFDDCEAIESTWSEGQLAIHDHVVQVLLLEVMNFASKLSSLLAWQHHWPANLPADS